MTICFVSYKYPGKHNQGDFAFVKQLVDAVAAQGHHCHVLAPFNVSHYHSLSNVIEDYTVGQGHVRVYRPNYISFSKFHVGKFHLSDWLHKRALVKAFKMMGLIPDVMYCHFWKAGYEGYTLAKKNNIPLFVASGESDIQQLFRIPKDAKTFSNYVKGVICVSNKNCEESVKLGLTTTNKCGVFPNAVNTDLFHKYNRKECRKRLGFPQEAFIVSFVGWFNERKGPNRVVSAIREVDNVKSIFIGKGQITPNCEGILFKGALSHEEVPYYLAASDCFVLPTLQEGCCNAVVEAMACGLPVISSNLPFNWDVLDDSNSLMIDPNNIGEISKAIKQLKENVELRERLSEGAFKKANSLSISQRADAIMNFIESRI